MEQKGRKMSKAFWQGFREGYLKSSIIVLPIAIAFDFGLALGSYSHPFEVCKRMYDTSEDIAECVWIKKTQ
jgi:hypothetical protein